MIFAPPVHAVSHKLRHRRSLRRVRFNLSGKGQRLSPMDSLSSADATGAGSQVS